MHTFAQAKCNSALRSGRGVDAGVARKFDSARRLCEDFNSEVSALNKEKKWFHSTRGWYESIRVINDEHVRDSSGVWIATKEQMEEDERIYREGREDTNYGGTGVEIVVLPSSDREL